jgi:hypothetical protein
VDWKWHFGKHEKSLTGRWGSSYWPQFGMAKYHFRPVAETCEIRNE